MGRRREPRLKFEVPVKVCGMDTAGHPFVQSAYAVSISRSGVRLTGVGPLVRVGETVVVIYKNRKARFKVMWIGDLSQAEAGQAGLEAVDPNALVWDFQLPYPGNDGYVPPDKLRPNQFAAGPSSDPFAARAMDTFSRPADSFAQRPQPPAAFAAPPSAAPPAKSGSERRTASRYKCRGSADIFVPNVSFPTRGQIDDISLSGVYIQTTAPLLVGSKVNLSLAIQGSVLQAEAEVRTSHPGVGMGLMFTNITSENRIILGRIVNRLMGVAASSPGKAVIGAPAAAAPQAAPAPRWDAIGRDISEWFRTHENLTRDEFYALIRRQ